MDLSLDAVVVYRRLENGLLEKYCEAYAPRGSGARHMVFSPDGRFAYIVSEMAACVSAYQYGEGRFKYLDTVSMLSENHAGKMSGSAIRITPDGAYLYAGNRFANQIAAFARDKRSGYVRPIGHTPCALPRDLNISPDGKCLYVCGSEDDIVEVFSIAPGGQLIRLCDYAAPAPASICFLDKPCG